MHLDRRATLSALFGAAALSLVRDAAASPVAPDRLRAADWGRERRFLRTRFGRICYVDTGSGEPALFLHGYPLNSFQWRGVIERLSLEYRCLAPDFMGLGRTEVSLDQDLSPIAQAKMIVAFLDGLSLASAHIVANDSGGAVAQLLLAHFPKRVRSLILTNGDTARQSPPAAMLPVIELARKGSYVSQWIEPWYENRERARAPDGFGGMCYADPSNPTDDAIEAYFGPILATQESRRLAELHAIAQAENSLAGIAPALRETRVPVRILWGTGDTIFSQTNADYLDSLFPGSRGVRLIRGAKLFWPEEQPGIIAEEALALWS